MERNINRMDAFTYREWLEKKPVVIIPVGSIEQHAAHMPLNTDCLLSTKMSELVAEEIDGIVGPTITTGYKSQQRSGGGNHIIGSFGFDADVVISVAQTLVREFHRHGVEHIVFCNGHYENYQFLYEGVDLAMREIQNSGAKPPVVQLMSYWDFVTEETIDRLYPDGFPGWDVEHGGVMETAIMLEYYPELVWMDRLIDHPAAELPLYDLFPVDPSLTPDSGALSSGKEATAEKGQILAASVIENMSAAIRERS